MGWDVLMIIKIMSGSLAWSVRECGQGQGLGGVKIY